MAASSSSLSAAAISSTTTTPLSLRNPPNCNWPTLFAKTLPTTLSVRRLFIPTHVPPTADRYVFAYIAFDFAYVNATHTNDYIDSLLKNVATTNHSKRPELARHLQRCHGFYGQGVQVLAEALNDFGL